MENDSYGRPSKLGEAILAMTKTPSQKTHAEVVRRIPEILVARQKGVSWADLAALFKRDGFEIGAHLLRTYFSKLTRNDSGQGRVSSSAETTGAPASRPAVPVAASVDDVGMGIIPLATPLSPPEGLRGLKRAKPWNKP